MPKPIYHPVEYWRLIDSMQRFHSLIENHFAFYASRRPRENDFDGNEMALKAKVSVVLSFTAAVALSILYAAIQIFELSEFVASVNYFLSASIILFLLLIIIRHKGYQFYYVPSIAIILSTMILAPLRIYTSGGIYSSVLIYASLPIMLAGLFFGRKGIGGIAFLWIIFVGFLYYSTISGSISPPNPKLLPFTSFGSIIGYTVIGITAYMFISKQNFYQHKIAKIERENVVSLFSAALSHEINNPLFIAKITAAKSNETKVLLPIDAERIKKSLDRIEQVIVGVRDLELKNQDLKTVPYTDKIDMIKFSNRQ